MRFLITAIVFLTALSTVNVSAYVASNPLNSNSGNVDGNLTELYVKIKVLFEASGSPYNLDDKLLKQIDSPALFTKCVVVNKDGQRGSITDVVAFRYHSTVKPGNGPLDPPVIHQTTVIADRNMVIGYVSMGAKFKNGLVDIDPLSNWGVIKHEDTGCREDMSDLEQIHNMNSGLSQDKKSYEFIVKCKDQIIHQRQEMRISGHYMVFRANSGLLKGSSDEFGYCWNEE